jgi:2-keto-4-pentenoate hydratase/dienelactone hydrolase
MKPKLPQIAALLLLAQSIQASRPHAVLDLWSDGKMPGPAALVSGEEQDFNKPGDKLIAGRKIIKLGNVSTPQAHVYLPTAGNGNGAAVVVCPGGGFSILAWDLEGTEVAEWLNRIGVAAIVLKYRVPTRQHGDTLEATGEGINMPKKTHGPVMDAQRAVSLARANAGKWGIDPARVGILGFSAGGETAALAALSEGKRAYAGIDTIDTSPCNADFAILVYPGGLADKETGNLKDYLHVTPKTPPMFFTHAADDRVTPLASSTLFGALEKAGIPAELHIFAKGGHGYGLRPTFDPITQWPAHATEWMQTRGILGDAELLAFAERTARAKLAGSALPQFSREFPKARWPEAWKAQREYVRMLTGTEKIAGFKGAVASEGGQKHFGIPAPLGGVLFKSGWVESCGKPVLPYRETAIPGVETELGIILSKTIRGKVSSVEELKASIQGVVPVIELPAGRHDWPAEVSAMDLVAVNVDSDNFIVGKLHPGTDLDLDALPIRLLRNGKPANETIGGNAKGGQWKNFLHQANWAIENGYTLEPGQIIISGALGKIGQDGEGYYEADFAKLGTISFSLAKEAR